MKAAPDRRDELLRPDRLPQDALDVEVIDVQGRSCDHHDGDVAGERVRGNLLPDRDPAQRGQHQIEHDEIRRLAIDPRQRFKSIPGFEYVVAFEQQRRSKHTSQFLVVFHEQDDLSQRHGESKYSSDLVLGKAQRYDAEVNRDAVLELIAQQQRSGFADVKGTEGQATIRMSDRLLNQIIATEVQRLRAIREARVRNLAGDRLDLQVVLAKPSFLPAITIGVLIERQPSLPENPVLVLRLSGIGGLTRFAGLAAAFLNVLPPGIRMAGDRVFVDVAALLQQRGMGFVMQHVDDLNVTTDEGVVRVAFRVRLR